MRRVRLAPRRRVALPWLASVVSNAYPQGGIRPLFTTGFRDKPEGAYFDDDAADRAVAFIERLHHTQGVKAGLPFTLSPEQRWLVREAFGWMRADGTRLYRTVYVEMGRGNGKSQLGAAIAGKLLFADGESDPEVIGAAKDRRQARRACLDRLKAMVRAEPALDERSEIFKSEIQRHGGGWYEATSSDVGSAWGGAPHGVIFDEVHAQPSRDLWDALVTGTGKRLQPMVWAFTTAGWRRDSLAWELREYTREIAEGAVIDPSFLGVVWAAAEDADWTDPDTWRLANPLMGEAFSEEFIAAECERAKSQPAFQNTFRTMYLSQWVGQETRFIDMTAWDACSAPADLRGLRVFGGLDLSSSTDLSALALVGERDGQVHVVVRCYAPADGLRDRARRDRAPYDVWAREGHLTLTPGATIDQDVIKADVLRFAKDLDVADVSFDRWNAAKVVRELQLELGEDRMVEMGQGFSSMSAPTKEVLRLVTDGRLRHGGNPLLRMMVDRAQAKTDPAGNIKPDKQNSSSRIDGLVATIMAVDGLMRRGRTAKRRSVYEDRGLMLA